MLGGIFSAVGTLIIVVVILYLTFACTKFLGKNMKTKSNSRYMQMIDQMTLSQDSSIAIVKIAGQLFLVGIASSQVSILSRLEEDDLVENTFEKEMKVPDFKDIMDRIGNRKK